MSEIYKPTDLDISKVLSFANETWMNHFNNTDRDKDKIISHIFIGKLGEISCTHFFNDLTEVNFTNEKDIGCDFISKNEKKVEVKTVRDNSKWVNIYTQKLDFDELIICMYYSHTKIELIGRYKYSDIKKYIRKSIHNNGYYIILEVLKLQNEKVKLNGVK